MLWESHKTLKLHKGGSRRTVKAADSKADHSAFGPVTKKIQGMKIWPMISLPTSGIQISLWIILAGATVAGFFLRFFGRGAGANRVTADVYLVDGPSIHARGTAICQ